MNKKKNKNTSNLIFSAFLITAFAVCSYFFEGMITSSTGMSNTVKGLISKLIFVVFGLLLFYATRVGDGKQIRRFSLSTLIIMDIPALYILLASVASGLPFSEQISSSYIITCVAAVVLGYGIPYTFLSGYEIQPYEDDFDYKKDIELNCNDDEQDTYNDEVANKEDISEETSEEDTNEY